MYTLETWNDLEFDYILESPRKNIMGFLIFYHGKPGIIMGFFSNKVLRTLLHFIQFIRTRFTIFIRQEDISQNENS